MGTFRDSRSPPVSWLPTAALEASCWLCRVRPRSGQGGHQFLGLRDRVMPGRRSMLMPQDVRDRTLADVRLAQPHANRVPQVVYARVGEVASSKPAFRRPPCHAVLLMVCSGWSRYAKTCVGCFPRRASTIDCDTRLRTSTRSRLRPLTAPRTFPLPSITASFGTTKIE